MTRRLPLSVLITTLVAVALWGSAPVGIRVALQGYNPGQLSFIRFGIGSVFLVAYAASKGIRWPRREDLLVLLLAGGVGITLYNQVLNYGLRTVSAGAASFLVASTPIWTALLAAIFLHERLSRIGWLGILVSFAGIGLIARERGHGLHFSPGAILIGVNAMAYGAYLILQKRLLIRYSALPFTVYSFVAGTLLLIPFAGGSAAALHNAPFRATEALMFLGIFPAAIANLAWARAMAEAPAARISSFLYLMPLATVLIAWLWLGEVPTLTVWAGGALALAGVVLVNVWGHSTQTEPAVAIEVLE